MFQVFLQSFRRHSRWWVASLTPGKHAGAPSGPRRFFFLFVLFPLFVLVQLLHWLGFLLDEVLFRGYRCVPVQAPLFITGIPRSGTTFVHRILAEDRDRFTSVTTWEAVLAPSITERKLLRMLARGDRLLGRPLRRLVDWGLARAAGDFEDIHPVAPGAPEEDYLVLLPAGACFLLLLAFPFARDLRALARFDEETPENRRRYLGFYRRCLQKHLYCAPPGKQLLSKNASFASWVPELRRTFPDSRILLCVREPASALSSQLSSLRPARRVFGTDPEEQVLARLFFDIFSHNYEQLAELAEAESRWLAVVDLRDLKEAPAETLAAVPAALGFPMAGRLREAVESLEAGHRSGHRHAPEWAGLDAEEIGCCIGPFYDRIVNSGCRISRKPK